MRSRPAPDHAPWAGDIAVRIECRGVREQSSERRHDIVIHDDWSVTTPHDLEAERVAAAFGGYTSCVEVVDTTLPLLRRGLTEVARRARPALRRGTRGEWRVATGDLAACCSGRTFASVRTVAEHLRSPRHLAASLSLPRWQVEAIVRGVAAVTRADVSDDAPPARLVREPGGLAQLWRAGIHPDEVPGFAVHASPVAEPLPVSFFEGLAYAGHDPGWITDVLTHRPDPDTATWLAWQPPPAILDGEWGRWLGFGISRADFALALEHLLSADAVGSVRAATGWQDSTAARAIIGWARIGCRPTAAQFGMLASAGVDHRPPGSTFLDAAVVDVEQAGAAIERTELGLMLALAGTRPGLIAAVRQGARAVTDILEREDHR